MRVFLESLDSRAWIHIPWIRITADNFHIWEPRECFAKEEGLCINPDPLFQIVKLVEIFKISNPERAQLHRTPSAARKTHTRSQDAVLQLDLSSSASSNDTSI